MHCERSSAALRMYLDCAKSCSFSFCASCPALRIYDICCGTETFKLSIHVLLTSEALPSPHRVLYSHSLLVQRMFCFGQHEYQPGQHNLTMRPERIPYAKVFCCPCFSGSLHCKFCEYTHVKLLQAGSPPP